MSGDLRAWHEKKKESKRPSLISNQDKHIGDYSNICYAGIDCYIPSEKKCAPQLPPDGFSCGNRKVMSS